MSKWTKEKIAEWIAIRTLKRSNYSNLGQYQQVLQNGIIVSGSAGSNDNVVIYKSDVLSLAGLDPQDFATLMNNTSFSTISQFIQNTEGGTTWMNQIDAFLTGSTLQSPDNVSQFIGFTSGSVSGVPTGSSIAIDPDKLNEVLNTEITELLPYQTNRQDLINNLFAQYNLLKPSTEPPYCVDEDDNYTLDTGPILDDGSGLTECGNSLIYSQWATDNNISAINTNGYIIRDNNEEDNNNTDQSLAWLVNDASRYLRDMELLLPQTSADDRPEYSEVSTGYLEIRNLNQSIVVKRGEHESPTSARGIGDTVILGTSVEGGSFTSCADAAAYWLTLYPTSADVFQCGMEIPEFLIDGFTMTQWVKFKDKVNSGTLFNFGNPLRVNNPFGIRLETFVVKEDEISDKSEFYDGSTPFMNNNYERFVNLIVREGDGSLRDSNFGNSVNEKYDTVGNNMTAVQGSVENYRNYTRVPIDFDEWYFIVARYKPTEDEDSVPSNVTDYLTNPEYWMNNVSNDASPIYTHDSGLGNRCKVEIISKKDLLRARGYKSQ